MQGHHSRLNVRPRPLEGESPRGYLIRLTQANGFKSASNLLSRLKYSGGVASFRPETTAGNALLVTLSESLKYDALTLREKLTCKAPQLDINRQAKFCNKVFMSHARVCPLCLLEQNFTPRSWDYATTVVCPVHDVLMIDSCPDCGQHLTFNRAHVNMSACCRAKLSTVPSTPANASKALKYSIGRVENGDMGFLAAWASATGRLQHPTQHVLPLPDISNCSVDQAMPWVESAAQLLCSPNTREAYRQFLRDTRVDFQFISIEAAELPFHAFQQEFGTYFIDLPQTKREAPAELSLSSLAGADGHIESIPAKSLAELLRCTISALSKLENNGYLYAASASNPPRFDVTPIIDVLRDIPLSMTVAKGHTYITLEKLLVSKLFLRFGLRVEDILLSVLNGDIQVAKPKRTTPLAKLQINECTVHEELHRIWSHYQEEISVVRLAKALNVTTSDLVELRRHNIGWPEVESRNSQPGQQLLAPFEWSKLRDEYIVLNRVCFFTGVPLTRAKKQLSAMGMHASLKVSTGSTPMLLFSRQDIDADYLLSTVQELSKDPTQYDGYRATRA